MAQKVKNYLVTHGLKFADILEIRGVSPLVGEEEVAPEIAIVAGEGWRDTEMEPFFRVPNRVVKYSHIGVVSRVRLNSVYRE